MLAAVDEMVLGFALGEPTSASAGYSAASMRNEDIKMAIVMTLLAGLPLAVAGFGIRRMDYPSTRDVGVGLLTGSGVAVLTLAIGPAVAETMTP